MVCKYCGKTVPNDSVFCAYCGKRLTTSGSTQRIILKPRTPSYMDCLRYVYTANRGYRIPSQKEIYPLVAISDHLISQGFTFCRASTADGINEITHTGDAAYNVVYRDLDAFRNHFVEDFFAHQKKECEKSGGWISSFNYGHVDVYLKKGELLFRAKVNGGNVVEWYGYTEQDLELIEQANEAMQRFLATCTHVDRKIHTALKVHTDYWD